MAKTGSLRDIYIDGKKFDLSTEHLGRTIEQIKNDRLYDAQCIIEADDYTDSYLKLKTECDSSERAKKRIRWVKKAEQIILSQNKELVLSLAAELCICSIERY